MEDRPISQTITIQGVVIDFPSSGDSPNWAQAVDQFAVAVQNALGAFVGPFDVPPQTYIMTSNANSNVDLPNLSFPTANVQGALIAYSVYRNTSSTTATETGQIIINYNSTFGTGLKWEVSREYVGDAQVTFNVTDVGQVQFSCALFTGTGHTGFITYQAKAVLQNS